MHAPLVFDWATSLYQLINKSSAYFTFEGHEYTNVCRGLA
jgi:hypothetical protein